MSEQGNKKSDQPPPPYPEAAKESDHLVSQENYVDEADSAYEANHEKPLESNLGEIMPITGKIESHENGIIPRETDAQKVEITNSNSNIENTFQDSKTVNDTTTPLEEHQSSSSQEIEEVIKLSVTCHVEEKKHDCSEIHGEGNRDDLMLEESRDIEDKSLEMNICIEESVSKAIEEKVQHGHRNNGDIQLPLKDNLNDVLSSPTETVPEVSRIGPSSETPDPKKKHIVLAEEINLTSDGSENPEKEPDSGRAHFSDQMAFMDDATPGMIEQEACSKENGEENTVKMGSSPDLDMVNQNKETKVIYTAAEQEPEECRDKKVVVVVPKTISVSNGLRSADKYDEGEKVTENLLVEETEKRNDDSTSTGNGRHNAGKAEESLSSFESSEGENIQVSLTSPFNLENGLPADSPTSSFNQQWDNGLCSKAAEDWNKCTVNLKQCSSFDVFIAEVSTSNAQKASIQALNPRSALEKVNHVQELEQNVQANSVTEGDYKQHLISETSSLPSSKPQENDARVSIESNPDHPVTRVKQRKSPSFEFGIPIDARSEESDQTPLLVRDKSLARSFSGHANVRFQNSMVPTDYGRKSLDYEPVAVEEKTIRMERNDSDISRDSFTSLLRKDGKPTVELAPEKKESHIADDKALESPSSEELALTSIKTSGKRRPRSSLLSACICCTAANN
ncbi:uncharacterized protein [Coffea arabica]|uniref:Uncharacterized protein n=1 Tax=Coffea arabica TaxID=13443 RepID=A0ABM4X5Q4_COFAR